MITQKSTARHTATPASESSGPYRRQIAPRLTGDSGQGELWGLNMKASEFFFLPLHPNGAEQERGRK